MNRIENGSVKADDFRESNTKEVVVEQLNSGGVTYFYSFTRDYFEQYEKKNGRERAAYFIVRPKPNR